MTNIVRAAAKAVAWDIDGTLIDSEPAHHAAMVAVCADHGLDLSDQPEARFRGVHVRDIWRALRSALPPDLPEQTWLQAVEDGFVAHAPRAAHQPHAVETVRCLGARGAPQCAVSNSSRRVVDANLAALGLSDLLQFSLSLDDVTEGKPDPEPYAAACRRLGLPPSEVVAVEDSLTGARSARAAGLFVIGYGPDLAASADVDRHVTDLRDVLTLIG